MTEKHYTSILTMVIILLTCLVCRALAVKQPPLAQGVASDTILKNYPNRLRRSESFLGVHFDIHVGPTNDRIGENVTEQMVENIIDKVKPDYIQCDTKGHPGYTSYPTKVGTPAVGFVRDQLRIWREVTARRGVALYGHYSGVHDGKAIADHPDWASLDENGNPSPCNTCVFSSYVDELLIPQFKELSDYGLDGVWVDGDSWGVVMNYTRRAMELFTKKTGITEIPRKPQAPHYFEYLEFCLDGYLTYLDHYVTELHKHNPDFQMGVNWGFSSYMPEPVTVDVDFISADLTGDNSVNSARFEARCIQHQSKARDLMVWGFCNHTNSCHNTKTAVQLQQEAAVVMSLGAGFQVYFRQKDDGSIFDWQMDVMGEVARFCRARQKFCHQAEPVPQIAILFSREASYRYKINSRELGLNGPWYYQNESEKNKKDTREPVQGILNSLLESQYSVEILMEHHLTGNMAKYPLIIIPEWNYLDEDFKKELLAYAKDGGNLLLMGPESAALFDKELGVSFTGKAQVKKQWLEHNGWVGAIKSLSRPIAVTGNTRPFGKIFFSNEPVGDYIHAASIADYGRGKIAGVYFNFGDCYYKARTAAARDFLDSLVRRLFPEPIVRVTGSHYVDVVVNRINGKLAVNLVNTSGPHAVSNTHVFDEIPCIGPLNITIRSKTKPRNLTLEPQGEKISYTYTDGKVKFTIPRLEIHSVIIMDCNSSSD